ncbi:MAG: hypothetical protein ABIJ65_11605, partial [Chloroflexota bacterium]
NDLLRLDHKPDLTEAGILSTCQWLAFSSRRLGDRPFNFLRRKIGNVAVNLALRRFLGERLTPFQTLELEPFSDPCQHAISLAGHRLHLNSDLLTDYTQIRTIQQDPAELLQASALTPLDQFVRTGKNSRDIYLFAFLLAYTSTSQVVQHKSEAMETFHYYLAVLPKNWSQPDSWAPLNPIALKSEANHPILVELGGLNATRSFKCAQVQLQPRTRTILTDEFYSLAYIHILEHPKTRLGLHSPRRSQVHIIQPSEWGNVMVCGLEIWLTGWMSLDEYLRRSIILPAGQKTFQYSHTYYKNLCVPVSELHPLDQLLEETRTRQADQDKL